MTNFIAQCDMTCADCGTELPRGSQIIILFEDLEKERIVCPDCGNNPPEYNDDGEEILNFKNL